MLVLGQPRLGVRREPVRRDEDQVDVGIRQELGRRGVRQVPACRQSLVSYVGQNSQIIMPALPHLVWKTLQNESPAVTYSLLISGSFQHRRGNASSPLRVPEVTLVVCTGHLAGVVDEERRIPHERAESGRLGRVVRGDPIAPILLRLVQPSRRIKEMCERRVSRDRRDLPGRSRRRGSPRAARQGTPVSPPI